MAEERRKHTRKKAPMEARWEGMAGRSVARVSDISLSGCFIDTIGKAEAGELISLSILTPRGEWLALQGRVAACEPNVGFGVTFDTLAPEQRDALEALLKALA